MKKSHDLFMKTWEKYYTTSFAKTRENNAKHCSEIQSHSVWKWSKKSHFLTIFVLLNLACLLTLFERKFQILLALVNEIFSVIFNHRVVRESLKIVLKIILPFSQLEFVCIFNWFSETTWISKKVVI